MFFLLLVKPKTDTYQLICSKRTKGYHVKHDKELNRSYVYSKRARFAKYQFDSEK